MTDRTHRDDQARAAVASYRDKPGVVGAYLAGSAIRGYADAHSDLDVWVVFENAAFDALPPNERHVVTWTSDGRKDAEIVCVSLERLEAEARTRCDGLRANRHRAVVLFATDDRLASLLERIGRLPDEEREPRARIAYRELGWAIEKADKARARGQLANARLLEGTALDAMWRLLIVASGERPTRPDWAAQEIRLAGVPDALADAWESALVSASPALGELKTAVDAWLTSRGYTFHHDLGALFRWIAHTAEGVAARERFSLVL